MAAFCALKLSKLFLMFLSIINIGYLLLVIISEKRLFNTWIWSLALFLSRYILDKPSDRGSR